MSCHLIIRTAFVLSFHPELGFASLEGVSCMMAGGRLWPPHDGRIVYTAWHSLVVSLLIDGRYHFRNKNVLFVCMMMMLMMMYLLLY